MKKIEIYCRNTGTTISINGGDTLLDIAGRLDRQLGYRPICARVNNKTESLRYIFYGPKTVEFLPDTTSSGRRAYVRTLCMILFAAVRRIAPGAQLSVCHSVSAGYFCRLNGCEVTPALVGDIAAEMHRLVSEDIPILIHEETSAAVRRRFADEGLDDKVLLLDTVRELYSTFCTLGDVADSYYGCLAPSTGYTPCFDLMPYRDGMLLLGRDSSNPDVPQQPVTQDKMFDAFTDYVAFNRVIGVSNVGELNRSTIDGRSAELINVAEALHDKKISAIADEITRRHHYDGCKVVLIAGPSSSGKTTFTKRLAIYLMTNLLKPKMISLDDYFVNREDTPRETDGEYDYESLYALDLKQFNIDMERLTAGDEVGMPTYNFELGRREYRGNTLRLAANDILLIEGIHGLNPQLTAGIADALKYRVYVSALTTLAIDSHNWVPTTDNRLLRRIIRDHKYRGTSPADTIRRWPSVRRGEEKWIFPYQENADSTFNSSLIFELGVMRNYAETLLRAIPRDVPEYAEAYRLLKFLGYFLPIPDRCIPPTSLLREFLGGSSFHY